METHVGIGSRSALKKQLTHYLDDMRSLLTGAEVPQAQAVLRRLLRGRLACTPQGDGSYTFKGVGTVEPVLSGVIPNVASPTGINPFTVVGAVGRVAA